MTLFFKVKSITKMQMITIGKYFKFSNGSDSFYQPDLLILLKDGIKAQLLSK